MSQICFQYIDCFYEQRESTAMKNPLSTFLANFFMTMFEIETKKYFQYNPRVSIKYVDDIFVVFHYYKCNVNEFINYPKRKFTWTKFIYKLEHNGKSFMV